MKLTNGKKLRLSQMIFDYWRHWMQVPCPDLDCNEEKEGLVWCDCWNATFWYMLNVSWYAMNDKLYAESNSREPFDWYLGDFDEKYLKGNNYG